MRLVQIPGKVLPAGTYAFKLLDFSDRRIVQVSDKPTGRMSTLLLTIPNQRMKPADKTYGHEFVYPKTQAVKIAKATHTPAQPPQASRLIGMP